MQFIILDLETDICTGRKGKGRGTWCRHYAFLVSAKVSVLIAMGVTACGFSWLVTEVIKFNSLHITVDNCFMYTDGMKCTPVEIELKRLKSLKILN